MSLVQTMYFALLYVMYDYPKYPGGEVRIREPFKKRRFWFCATRIMRVASSMKVKGMAELLEKDLRRFRTLDAHDKCTVELADERLGGCTNLSAVFQLGKLGLKK
jgi:hypothetical protein